MQPNTILKRLGCIEYALYMKYVLPKGFSKLTKTARYTKNLRKYFFRKAVLPLSKS